VSVVKPGMPFQVVANFQSKRKTPTMLAFASGERLFGADAEALLGRKPMLVLASPLALLGRNASHPLVRAALYESFQAADVRPAAARGGLEAHFPAAPAAAAAAGFGANATELVFPVEELAAMLLAHARDFASHVADQRIQDAVITVPAYAAQGASPGRAARRGARLAAHTSPRRRSASAPPCRRAPGAHRRGGACRPQSALAHRREHGHGRALRH
jgi:hypoxia up-regulated 1